MFSIGLVSQYRLAGETSTYLRSMFTEKVVNAFFKDGHLMLRIIDNIKTNCFRARATTVNIYERYNVTFELNGPATRVKARHVRGNKVVEIKEEYDQLGQMLWGTKSFCTRKG